MIPLFAVVRVHADGRRFGLWLPLFLAWLLLLPLLLVLLPFVVIGCLVARMNPLRLLKTVWQLLAGLSGTNVDVQYGERQVQVRMF